MPDGNGFDGKARVLAYGADNRLTSVNGGVTYWHNAEGQRVIARGDKGLRHFVYDVQDRLVAEAEADGTVVREYFYLDRVPVAMLNVANDRLYFVHGDHLGTPRQVTDAEGDVVWTGEALAFGATKAEGAVRLDFRFPGQVEDRTTGYFYNYFRDYDASVGRYLQSDPIGLAAGVNTYSYVGSNPSNSSDYFGLETNLITTFDYGVGTHSALHISGKDGSEFLYDPAGSYRSGVRGTGDFFEGEEAGLKDYISYQKSLGSEVSVTTLDTTPRQESNIMGLPQIVWVT